MRYSIIKRFLLTPITYIKRTTKEYQCNKKLKKRSRSIEEMLIKLAEKQKKFLYFERHSNKEEALKYSSQVKILKWILRKK